MQHAGLGRHRGQVGRRVEHPQGHALQREGILPSKRAVIAGGGRLRPADAYQDATQRNCCLQAVTHVFSPLLGKWFSGDHPSRSSRRSGLFNEGRRRAVLWVLATADRAHQSARLYSGPTRQLEYASTWPLSVAMTVMSSPLGATNISWVACTPGATCTLMVPVQSALII